MYINSTSNKIQKYSQQLSTGKRVNSAKDDAAGLAIAQKMLAQINGYDKGTQNTLDMKNLVTTAEGGMSAIGDSLQRIRELSVQAANTGVLSEQDQANIQNEIGQLLGNIDSITSSAEFNNKKLLDGSFQNQHTASSPDGSGKDFSISSLTVEKLGLKDFDVTKKFNINDIDNALNILNTERGKLGAISNSFDYTVNSNDISSLNLAASRSRIVDADMGKAVSELGKAKLLQQYQIYGQKRKMEQQKSKLAFFK